jgi:putative oxidoreductase
MSRFLRITNLLLRIGLGAVFLYAGALKAGDPRAFAEAVAAYRLLPPQGNLIAASVLPWIEILAGLLLIIGIRARGAAAVTIILNVVFVAALASAAFRGLDIDCGCFRKGTGSSPGVAILRDLLLLAAAVAVVRGAGIRPRPCAGAGNGIGCGNEKPEEVE